MTWVLPGKSSCSCSSSKRMSTGGKVAYTSMLLAGSSTPISRGAPFTALASKVVASSCVGRRRARGRGCCAVYEADGLARSATRAPLPRMMALSKSELECRLARRQARAASSDRWLDGRRLASWVAKAMLAVRRRALVALLVKGSDAWPDQFETSERRFWAQFLHHAGVM